jgi:hypothetical protein
MAIPLIRVIDERRMRKKRCNRIEAAAQSQQSERLCDRRKREPSLRCGLPETLTLRLPAEAHESGAVELFSFI